MKQEMTPNISSETAAEWRRIEASWDPTRHPTEPKTVPRYPKGTPGQPKESPRVAKETPKGPHQSPSRQHKAPKGTQRDPNGHPKPPKEPNRKQEIIKIFPAKRPQSGDDLKQDETISDKTAAEWRRHHARSPQPGNKNGGGRVAAPGRSLPTHNRTGGRDYIYKGTVWRRRMKTKWQCIFLIVHSHPLLPVV